MSATAGRPCHVLLKGVTVGWLAATLIKERPGWKARIDAPDPIWRGAVVDSKHAYIRVEPKAEK